MHRQHHLLLKLNSFLSHLTGQCNSCVLSACSSDRLIREFPCIFGLCSFVLSASQRTELIRATLETLHAFLSWIPLVYIFQMPLLETLMKFFPVTSYSNLTLQCLTKVAARQSGDYGMYYVKMYNFFMVQLQTILRPETNIPETYADGSSEQQAFIQNLALFFTSFYKSHIRILEAIPENGDMLLLGLGYLIGISDVDNTEIFKVCLEFWNFLVLELFEGHHNLDTSAATLSTTGFQTPLIPGMVVGLGSPLLQRQQLYSGPLSKLRILMVGWMAKSEVVLNGEDENDNIVRETMKVNDVLQYKIMKETLTYLYCLDHEDTEQQVDTRVIDMNNGNHSPQRTSLRHRSFSLGNKTVAARQGHGHGRGSNPADGRNLKKKDL